MDKGLEELLSKMKDMEFFIHKVLKKFVVKLGGKYQRGPFKDADRILAKAAKDYGFDFYRVLDIVRASGIFNSICEFERVVLALLAAAPAESPAREL